MSAGQRPACGGASGAGILIGGNQSAATIAQALSSAGFPDVEDRTGLEGNLDFVLRYTPPGLETSAAGGAGILPDHPELLTAVQEQLGLKLEPTRAEVPYFLVDHAEWPSLD